MTFKIELTENAYKDYACLERKLKLKIGKVIDRLVSFSPHLSLDIKKLKTPFDGYRLRIGDYRMLFTVSRNTIIIYSIKHRKDAYK